jgi:hypothetical protein
MTDIFPQVEGSAEPSTFPTDTDHLARIAKMLDEMEVPATTHEGAPISVIDRAGRAFYFLAAQGSLNARQVEEQAALIAELQQTITAALRHLVGAPGAASHQVRAAITVLREARRR